MKYLDMKKKVLALIEELSPQSEYLTEDPDIQAKYEHVMTQAMFEMARIKKIPGYAELKVNEGELVTFETIKDETDHDIYQIDAVKGVRHEYKAMGTVIKALEDGVAEVEYFRYPTRVTDKNREKYVFDLTDDVLEILPYGIAGDLLKSDVAANYGKIYQERYENMKNMLDPRYKSMVVTIEGGINW